MKATFRALAYRIEIAVINIVFPPLAIALLCGFGLDLILSCGLFLLAVLPSHVHALYVSQIYFHRRRKVKKGKWPGPLPAPLIASHNVLNGGATDEEVRRLWRKEFGGTGVERRGSRASDGSRVRSRSRSRQGEPGSKKEMVQRSLSERMARLESNNNSNVERTRRGGEDDEHTARDGYGTGYGYGAPPRRSQSQRPGRRR